MIPPPDPVIKGDAKRVRQTLELMLRKPFHDSNKRERDRAWSLWKKHIERELSL